MNETEYFHALAEELARAVTPSTVIKKFVDNTAVIGAYAEASVNRLIKRMVAPLRVSTGAVIGPKLCVDPKAGMQIDTIIWAPSPFPAILEAGDFALVPRESSFAVLEVKRSNYSGVGTKIKNVLDSAAELTNSFVVAKHPGLGVVALKEHGRRDAVLDELIAAKDAVVVLERTEDEQYIPNVQGILDLVNFLASIRLRARIIDGKLSANPSLDAGESV